MSDRSTQTVLSEAPKDVGAEVSALPAVDVATPATIITATLSEGTGRKEAQCLRDGFKKVVFKCRTAGRTRCFTKMLSGQMERSRPNVPVI